MMLYKDYVKMQAEAEDKEKRKFLSKSERFLEAYRWAQAGARIAKDNKLDAWQILLLRNFAPLHRC